MSNQQLNLFSAEDSPSEIALGIRQISRRAPRPNAKFQKIQNSFNSCPASIPSRNSLKVASQKRSASASSAVDGSTTKPVPRSTNTGARGVATTTRGTLGAQSQPQRSTASNAFSAPFQKGGSIGLAKQILAKAPQNVTMGLNATSTHAVIEAPQRLLVVPLCAKNAAAIPATTSAGAQTVANIDWTQLPYSGVTDIPAALSEHSRLRVSGSALEGVGQPPVATRMLELTQAKPRVLRRSASQEIKSGLVSRRVANRRNSLAGFVSQFSTPTSNEPTPEILETNGGEDTPPVASPVVPPTANEATVVDAKARTYFRKRFLSLTETTASESTPPSTRRSIDSSSTTHQHRKIQQEPNDESHDWRRYGLARSNSSGSGWLVEDPWNSKTTTFPKRIIRYGSDGSISSGSDWSYENPAGLFETTSGPASSTKKNQLAAAQQAELEVKMSKKKRSLLHAWRKRHARWAAAKMNAHGDPRSLFKRIWRTIKTKKARAVEQ